MKVNKDKETGIWYVKTDKGKKIFLGKKVPKTENLNMIVANSNIVSDLEDKLNATIATVDELNTKLEAIMSHFNIT